MSNGVIPRDGKDIVIGRAVGRCAVGQGQWWARLSKNEIDAKGQNRSKLTRATKRFRIGLTVVTEIPVLG